MSNNAPFFKPWKDGIFENSVKLCGGILLFFFISGILGADYDPVNTNPYVWGYRLRLMFVKD